MEYDLQSAERVETMSVNDDPHDWYAPHKFDEDAAVPQTYDTDRGNILLKEVDYSTIECPECGTEARKDERATPVCSNEECGVVCTAPERPDHEIIRDPKTAERVDDNGNFIQ
jgi:hypothetical protein